MYKLIAFDLDGTFLDKDKKIPEENLRAIERAAEEGVHIVPATGRLFSGMPKELLELPYIRYYILINGAKVYDALEDRVISTAYLPNSLALDLMDYGDTLPILYDCYINDGGKMRSDMYARLEDYVDDKAYVKFMRSVREPVDDIKGFVSREGCPVQKVQYFFRDMSLRTETIRRLPEMFPGVRATSSMSMNIEINSASAGKGPALAALCRALGFTEKEAVAFGDGTNDLDMIKAAGLGVAMANSSPEVLQGADTVTLTNNEGGVGKAINQIFFS